MAAKIRLQRFGKKGHAFYRIVIMDESKKRQGRVIEPIGTYDPYMKHEKTKINSTLLKKWLLNGAQPTETVKKILNI